MDTKALAFGIIGFLLGGLVVSTAATYLEEEDSGSGGSQMTMSQMSDDLEGKTGDDFDEAFITSMIEHHQGALDMARLSASRAEHREIKDLSEAVITAQEKEIARMKQWQQEWGYDTAPDADHSSH
ncbi:MAG: hypothetical protein AVDCRST_MAG34-3085 [uncultured Nocardioidaceae bacterium]|uniref:DUF305 domain-containing protein n=1 Tax=uncultured Nocardioidaceae bacterium TaxID=253824 RepID=A0A6J4MXN1_9ACTN|nr:MAG: hypothetical protein AVDCRST_MAG34-3085 [uncultured Nocardioidaceae bacterium]